MKKTISLTIFGLHDRVCNNSEQNWTATFGKCREMAAEGVGRSEVPVANLDAPAVHAVEFRVYGFNKLKF